MGWDTLYERASEYEITVADIQKALTDRRKAASNAEGKNNE